MFPTRLTAFTAACAGMLLAAPPAVAASGQGLETVATVPLGPNRALHLVRAGRELMLLGVAEQTVVPIRAYREDEARALGLIDTAETFDADEPPQPPTPAP